MGFWKALSNVAQGKPVFETPQHTQTSVTPKSASEQGTTGTTSSKNIPTVVIERTEYHNNGSHMRVTVDIKNHSSAQIELDKIRLLGVSTEIDTALRPGEARGFNVFQGNRPTNRNYDDAFLVYKDETGDYFEAHHVVEFSQEPDNTYSVVRFRFVGPVKDI